MTLALTAVLAVVALGARAQASNEELSVSIREVAVPLEHQILFKEMNERNFNALPGTLPGGIPGIPGIPTTTTTTTPTIPGIPTIPSNNPGGLPGLPGMPGANPSPWNPGTIMSWVNLGKQVWDIIQSLAGTMKLEPMTGVGVVPMAAGGQMVAMSGWKVAQPKTYEMKIYGNFGEAFSYTYTVGYNYGGRYQGKGQFLANVAIVPFNAKCGWSWTCSAAINVGQGMNTAESETDPVPVLPVMMLVNAQGRTNAKATGVQFQVYGDGRLEQTVQNLQ